jgi:hypothetical protein
MLPLLLLLGAFDGGTPMPDAESLDAGAPSHAAVEVGPTVTLRGAAEAEVGLFPSGFGENGADFMLALRPVAGIQVGDVFQLELGPTFRLRVIDTPPDNRAGDFGGVLRGADWDELSDYGQIIQSLRIGSDNSPFFVRAGPARKKTLGQGHLINRYSNQENPDYHPASGTAVLALGPVRTEFFASDILGGRLFAGELAWDLGRTFSDAREVRDRYVLALQAVHDASRAGLPFRPDPLSARVAPPALTLLQLDASAMLVRTQSIRVTALAGLGNRVDAGDLGFVAGGAFDVSVTDIGISVKLELRKQAGGFRQGFFGPTWELSRYADTGFSGQAQGLVSLPNDWSVMGEARLGLGTTVSVDLFAEHFFFGRTDLDSTFNLVLFKSWLLAQARATVVGLGATPRWSFTASLKLRLFGSLYLTGSGGTVFFPQLDGTLLRGVSVMAGVGVDFER